MDQQTPHPSPIETLKVESRGLRGNIAAELAVADEPFSKDTADLVKHHGMYQQQDRDLRKAGKTPAERHAASTTLLVRTKIPGGRLDSRQFLAHLDLCDELGSATLRVTTRQDLQIHGVRKANVGEALRRINAVGLTTFGACGDVARNVMCCPAPHRQDTVHEQMQQMAEQLTAQFAPRSRAYEEIWLCGPAPAAVQSRGHETIASEEPLYGEAYLPRKFKMGIGLAGDNCVDLHSQDLGLLAICENFNVVGYNLLVGGGLGSTPGNSKTFMALAQPFAFVAPEQVVEVATAIVRVFRDSGNRSDRKQARLKYLIADWRLEKFRTEVEASYGSPLAPPRPENVWNVDDHLGWHDQGDGRWFYGLSVENGRICDREGLRLKTALREICQTWRPGVCLTPQQNVLLTDLAGEHRAAVEEVLRRHGVPLSEAVSNVRRWSMACVALPTCPLALTESERALPGVIDALETELQRLQLAGEVFSVRMTGCSNGCARPCLADVRPGGQAARRVRYLSGRAALGRPLGATLQGFRSPRRDCRHARARVDTIRRRAIAGRRVRRLLPARRHHCPPVVVRRTSFVGCHGWLVQPCFWHCWTSQQWHPTHHLKCVGLLVRRPVGAYALNP